MQRGHLHYVIEFDIKGFVDISQEKMRIVNVKRRYSEFLGFKIKVHSKGKKQVIKIITELQLISV